MNIPLIRRFGLPLVLMAASALLLAGCNDSSPTEPKLTAAATPTPIPTPGNIAGAWTGTYVSSDDVDCDTSIVFPAKAAISQNGSDVGGTLTATGDPNGCPCGSLTFAGTLHGNALEGATNGPRSAGLRVRGTLSGSTLDIYLGPAGAFQFHR